MRLSPHLSPLYLSSYPFIFIIPLFRLSYIGLVAGQTTWGRQGTPEQDRGKPELFLGFHGVSPLFVYKRTLAQAAYTRPLCCV